MRVPLNRLVACALVGALPSSTELHHPSRAVAAPVAASGSAAQPATVTLRAAALADAGHPVILVLYDDFSTPGVVATVRRTGRGGAPTIISIKRLALTPGLLYTTIRLVPSVVQRHADGRASSTMIVISRRDRLSQVPDGKRARIEELMARLVAAPERELPKTGRHPVLEVTDDL